MKIGSMLFVALLTVALATTAWAGDWQGQDNDWQRHDGDWQTHDNNWQGQDGQYACMGDAMTVCWQFVPDRERVAHCLMSNRARVSVACRVALTHWRG